MGEKERKHKVNREPRDNTSGSEESKAETKTKSIKRATREKREAEERTCMCDKERQTDRQTERGEEEAKNRGQSFTTVRYGHIHFLQIFYHCVNKC